jgi:hypothetical protein
LSRDEHIIEWSLKKDDYIIDSQKFLIYKFFKKIDIEIVFSTWAPHC